CLLLMISSGSLAQVPLPDTTDTTRVLVPDFYPAPLIPADNQPTPARIQLGKRLFGEPLLSDTGDFSCATCHQPDRHFTDGRTTAIGATGAAHRFNTPTLYNVAFNASYGWTDTGTTTLEDQHLIPLQNRQPVEMGYRPELLQALLVQPDYAAAFAEAYTDKPDTSHLVKAIAAYVRTLRAPVSAFDKLLFYDDASNFGAREQTGMGLFFSPRLGCATCHASINFSGPVKHEQAQAAPVLHVTGVGGGGEAFRAPSLRQVARTAPYMHDGSLATLAEVLTHYEQVSLPDIPDFMLTEKERDALIAFLEAL
ncbi:MAG: cytochrome c peroxidase, partial [Pseudomonadota bacterium]